ncbi:MAG: hypothetical protein U1F61_06565 [Opitutaceae bacterium]
MAFLRDLARDVIDASRVSPGTGAAGRSKLANTTGVALITPGKDTYPAYWIRDFSMALESGLIGSDEIRDHLVLAARTQSGPTERMLANGLYLPPWSIPDHINYDGRPTFYPGTYASGDDQGSGKFGRLPPIDDHYEFVHIAYAYYQATRDATVLRSEVAGVSLFERLENAFASPRSDPSTGLAETTEADRAVGFGFCDGVVHTGKLLFASLLRYRAAGELAELASALGHPSKGETYRNIQRHIGAHLAPTFGDPANIDGWLRASTGISRQPDVWGTLFALHLGVLDSVHATAARQTIADAARRGTIAFQGGVRQVPTDRDFSDATAWERCAWRINTYQNGGYWHTATGWLIEALWDEDRALALDLFAGMIAHLRREDFRQGPGHGAPWEVFGRTTTERQNAIYMVSVALPYGVLKRL